VPVLGTRADLERIMTERDVREVIIAIPGASGSDMRAIFDTCRSAGARFRTVPTRGELARGVARISQIRLVDVDDLLGREVVRLDQRTLREELRGRRILVTGAAGSIGRELARQIAAYEPARLTLLDRNENNLFYLEAELRERGQAFQLDAVVGDVADRGRLTALMRDARPHVVFHAAAYKHVPLMESNPSEAIKNNVLATRALVDVSAALGVERFIYVSTDKAVHPSSVMGATKRLGERLVKSVKGTRTSFMAVRFGNVLGSDGSVVPIFRRQIAAGGPVTVTHPEATRYFMTIPEAVQLVLAAGAIGSGGDIFLLRMGEPVRIADLARNMIALSGLRVDDDIKLVYTGLRPGEKLHEELQSDGEQALATSNDKIMILSGVAPFSDEEWRRLAELETAAIEGGDDAVRRMLSRLVPEYAATREVVAAASPQNVVEMDVKRRVDAQG
jgi:FlaA1/EpsC-like NDP-sugar epimerase